MLEAGRRLVVRGLMHTKPAHVAQTPEQGTNIGTGYVLIAPSTDPGWIPLFLHAAAVVNVAGMMDKISNHMSVTVDGDRGVVEIVRSS